MLATGKKTRRNIRSDKPATLGGGTFGPNVGGSRQGLTETVNFFSCPVKRVLSCLEAASHHPANCYVAGG